MLAGVSPTWGDPFALCGTHFQFFFYFFQKYSSPKLSHMIHIALLSGFKFCLAWKSGW